MIRDIQQIVGAGNQTLNAEDRTVLRHMGAAPTTRPSVASASYF